MADTSWKGIYSEGQKVKSITDFFFWNYTESMTKERAFKWPLCLEIVKEIAKSSDINEGQKGKTIRKGIHGL